MKYRSPNSTMRTYALRTDSFLQQGFSLCLLVVIFLMPVLPVFASDVDPAVVSQASNIPSASSEVESPSVPETEFTNEPASDVLLTSDSETTTFAVPENSVVSDFDPLLQSTDSLGSELQIPDMGMSDYTPDAATGDQLDEQEALPLADQAFVSETTETQDELDSTEVAVALLNDVGSTQEDTAADALSSDNTSSTTTDVVYDVPNSALPALISEDEYDASAIEATNNATTTTDTENEGDEEAMGPTPLESHTVSYESSSAFDQSNCIRLGSGAYYCPSTAKDAVTMGTNRVFSAQDADGDREIFVERDNQIIQITTNQFEDDAPFYDEISDTFVWHRLIDGRYQIMSYNTEQALEVQVTNDRFNNMEPSRYDDVVVWQSWIGNDWDIVIEENGERRFLTDNTLPDVGPRVNGNYIVWQSFNGTAWFVQMLDRATGELHTIADVDGSSIDNPRFVLVYDTKLQNGDVETKGYDLESKEITPLTATPAPIPDELPEPDQTGEDRALLQTVTQLKLKTESDDDDTRDTAEDTLSGQSSTTTTLFDLVVPPRATSTDLELSNENELPLSSTTTIPDVVISPTIEENPTGALDDLIVLPYGDGGEGISTPTTHTIIVTEA